jgi:hypothetical protein
LDESLQPHQMQQRGQRFEFLIERCGRNQTGIAEVGSLLRCSVPRFTTNPGVCRSRKTSVPSLRSMLASATVLASRLGPSSLISCPNDSSISEPPR